MKKAFLLIAALTIAIPAMPLRAQTVRKYTATKSGDYGIPYTLPATAIDVTIETLTAVREPGEFYKYARRYFNIDDPITTPSTETVINSVVINTHGEPNTDERYVATFKPGYAPFMMLSPDNIPLAINTENLYEAGKLELPMARSAQPTPLETAAARQAMSEEIMQSQSTAKRAELVAARIFELRQSRNDLITGQADQMPPDGKSMELILKTINDQEAALMAMFVGTVKTWTDVRTITLVPAKDDMGERRVIARLSTTDGLVDADDLSGTPLYLSFDITERPSLPRNSKGETVAIPEGGFIFCLPASVTITVSDLSDTLARIDTEMAQYGVVNGLKPNTFTDKKAPAYAIFNPATGAIMELGSSQQ